MDHWKLGQVRGTRRNERGFTLILLAFVLVLMVAILGLALDLGFLFVVKTELQTFADAAALAAVQKLDGTPSGVSAANVAATQGAKTPNAWNFGTIPITHVTATYATAPDGPYEEFQAASSTGTNRYRAVKVVASVTIKFNFLPVIEGVPKEEVVTASAVAGQQPLSGFSNGGLAPFSPAARDPNDKTNFGLTPGQQYTLLWGDSNTTTCAADSGFSPGSAPPGHGFVDLGQEDRLREAIVYGGYPKANSATGAIKAGAVLNGAPGGTAILALAAERSNQDTDQASTTWEQYKASAAGNGRRIVTVAIHDPALNSGAGSQFTMTAIGFGNFLLDPGATISNTSGPICATYIGPGSLNGWSSGSTDGTQVYKNVLYQ